MGKGEVLQITLYDYGQIERLWLQTTLYDYG
jgi:hypothetical protein